MSERLYHGYTLEQIEKMGGDNEACIAYDMIAHIRELEADLARVTAERDRDYADLRRFQSDVIRLTSERDARVELPGIPPRHWLSLLNAEDHCLAWVEGEPGEVASATGPTTAAALEALKSKMEERK